MLPAGSLRARIARSPPIVIDAAIGAAIVIIGAIEVMSPTGTKRLPQVGLLLLGALGVTLRRRAVWLAFAIVQVPAVLGLLFNVPFIGAHEGYLAELILLYTVSETRGADASIFALLVVMSVDYLGWRELRAHWPTPVSDWVFYGVVLQDIIWIGLGWFAGRAQDRRRRIAGELERGAAALRAERDRLAAAAVARERARIAQDLHGLVVRGVREMNARTRSATLRLTGDGGDVLPAIEAVEAKGRETLLQMRRLLSVLRAPSEGPGQRPDVSIPNGSDPRSEPIASGAGSSERST